MGHLDHQRTLRKVVVFLPAIAWGLFIVVVSLLPNQMFSARKLAYIPMIDKIVHAGVYIVLAVAIMFGIIRTGTYSRQFTWLQVVAICALLGLILEILQAGMAVGRHFEVLDIIANICGAAIGAVAFTFITKTT